MKDTSTCTIWLMSDVGRPDEGIFFQNGVCRAIWRGEEWVNSKPFQLTYDDFKEDFSIK